jgi:alkaline phosphatase D
MGKLTTPLIPQETIDKMELPERYSKRLEGLQQIAEANLPMNLDAWDGYPACRERIHGLFTQFGKNPVVLAGDTHNAWAFNMRNGAGDAVGVEIGTPGITSPGMEAYLPAPPEMMREALLSSSAELHDLDTSQRGWTVVEFTPEQVTSTWRFVSTILESQYSVVESTPITCKAGDRSFS